MAVFAKPSPRVPADLERFDYRRWIRHALDKDDPFLRNFASSHTRAQVLKWWYAIVIVAPSHYRRALREAIGESEGDEYFYEVAKANEVAHRAARKADAYGI